MARDKSLNGLKVLITRPHEQAQKLYNEINDAGGEALLFPVIEIVTIPYEQWAEHDLAKQDMIIFISRNAVSNFVRELKAEIPQNNQLVAIGRGTANSMQGHGLRVDIQPTQSSGSHALLTMLGRVNVTGKNILIVRGKGGRELLADSLGARGAKINYIEAYQRRLATPSASQYEQALKADCIVCTSVMGVDNVSILLKNEITSLLAIPIVVVSERIQQHALSLGFERVIVTSKVSDNAIVHQLMEMEK
ncbi:MAG: uroporphyrinogen-III synthase [Methylophagaceae bacterium]